MFRPDIGARDLYLLVAAAGYFHQSNRFTLSSFLGEDVGSDEAVASWERFVIDIVSRGVRQPPIESPRTRLAARRPAASSTKD